ncbi:hypothetical protein [Pseudoalteromonas tunicata]|jgi:hypothetical protein|uniref:PilZ domain-containing protein n=1 Tax=Pseudoalteromonas tunicata D2 TaxID=87626 RepID=A4C4R1_9GAMM|nr:hypothetical protein [Pseudoalteromonas tunicata]ATC96978.1 hypothetical protein PTUN_b0624 [Pseudoalteromonas tunicata]AXT33101.1 hypothetical protein D1819_19985 [Pseudoalteromonas tunicata]EAR30543.1 hypothetical protein PTD2_03201 [Pseudoalteromonas tunicata D2]MDP4982135.1 hypothetical protein [Pseudoalteromonas tunicata]MDP5213900.1 hypothetical protein [Pseudoalteromonas tunicata]
MEFTAEELSFFKNVFRQDDHHAELDNHKLTVQTHVPSNLSAILENAKLTLLAEIGHYQLWFPLSLEIDDFGEFKTKLGTPEVVDVNGLERSWRIEAPENVTLYDESSQQKYEVLSLSSTGLTLRPKNDNVFEHHLSDQSLQINLPDLGSIKLSLEPVRTQNNIISARFQQFDDGRDKLRKFLFNLHRTKYSHLYGNLK